MNIRQESAIRIKNSQCGEWWQYFNSTREALGFDFGENSQAKLDMPASTGYYVRNKQNKFCNAKFTTILETSKGLAKTNS